MITTARRTPAEAAEKTASPEGLPFRAAPHNLEAEQALLGAILVNNEAHDRVSGFLEPQHFYDPLHQQIYETAAKLIANGKQATPITLKTFFETAEPIDATLTVSAVSGTPRGQRRHHHQRPRLRPHHLRPRHPSAAHRRSARTWSIPPTTARSISRPRSRSRKLRRASSRWPRPESTARASRPSPAR